MFLKLFQKSVLTLGSKLCLSTHWHSFKIKMTIDTGTNSDLKIHMVNTSFQLPVFLPWPQPAELGVNSFPAGPLAFQPPVPPFQPILDIFVSFIFLEEVFIKPLSKENNKETNFY